MAVSRALAAGGPRRAAGAASLLEAVVNALARLPVELRPRGVAFLVARVLTRLGFTGARR